MEDAGGGSSAPPTAPVAWPPWTCHAEPMHALAAQPPPVAVPAPPPSKPVYQPSRPPLQKQQQQQQQQQQHNQPMPAGGDLPIGLEGGGAALPRVFVSPPSCWRCGCAMQRTKGARSGYICEHKTYCGGTRKRAEEAFELVVLELKGPDLKEFSLSLPRNPFQRSSLPAFLRRRKLDVASVRQSSSGEPQCEAVFPLCEYNSVLAKVLDNAPPNLEVRAVPPSTLQAAREIVEGRGLLPLAEVEERLRRLPAHLSDVLLDFQLEGVRYALSRGGRCLIADEMGTGKTLQALAAMACYREDWPLLIVVPASLRLLWAETVERWLPYLRPSDIHVIFDQKTRLYDESQRPPVVISSYAMIRQLSHTLAKWEWGCVIFDESHKLATSRKSLDPVQTRTCMALGQRAKRLLLLTGTPSLSRPFDLYNQVDLLRSGLLGKDRWDFGRNYCTGVRWATRAQRLVPLVVYDGCRHDSELHAVLTGSVMIRRLKSQVLSQLPKLIRTVVRVAEKGGKAATTSTTDTAAAAEEEEPASLWDDVSSSQAEMIRDEAMMLESEAATGRPSEYHLVGRSKLAGALEWVSEWLQRARLLREGEEGRKLVLFGYHLDVLDGLQKRVQEVLARQQAGGRRRKKRGKKKDEEEGDEEDDEEEDDEEVADEGAGGKPLSLIRIDGHVPGQGRQALVAKFRDDPHCIVAIIGITAGGVGLDLTAASCAAFIELPPTASWLRQAEDRLHRRGQRSTVNIYYLVQPPGSWEDAMWQRMNRALRLNSALVNSREAAEELRVDRIVTAADEEEEVDGSRLSPDEDEMAALLSLLEEKEAALPSDNAGVVGGGDGEPFAAPADAVSEAVDVEAAAEAELLAMADEAFQLEEGEGGGGGKGGQEGEEEKEDGGGQTEAEEEEEREEEEEGERLVRDLWVEFSRHTGLIHLHGGADGSQPLEVQLDGSDYWAAAELLKQGKAGGSRAAHRRGEAALVALSLPPRHRLRLSHEAKRCLLEAISEYRAMTSRQRQRLFGHVLRPPLTEWLKRQTAISAGSSSSFRRHVPHDEWDFNRPPEDPSVPFRKVLVPIPRSSGFKERFQRLDDTTRQPLCLKCYMPCSFSGSPRVLADLVCSVPCLEYLQCRFKGGYRRAVADRDQGVCELCQMDCRELVNTIKVVADYHERVSLVLGINRLFEERPKLLERLCKNPVEGNAWHADHIVQVSRGGGECGDDNLRTLCVLCHAVVTAKQHAERVRSRRRKRQREEEALPVPEGKMLAIGEDGCVTAVVDDDTQQQQQEEAGESRQQDAGGGGDACMDDDDDDLLVLVPASW